jgi:hypothetical protein
MSLYRQVGRCLGAGVMDHFTVLMGSLQLFIKTGASSGGWMVNPIVTKVSLL